MRENKHIIREVLPDSIAEEMQMEPGDEIVQVNGEDVYKRQGMDCIRVWQEKIRCLSC